MRFRKLKQQSKQKKQSKEHPPIRYAKYTDRIKALITDMFMIYAPILYFITYAIMGDKDSFQSSAIAQFSGVFLYGFSYAILLAKTGQTPGKKAYEIKVVDDKTHQNISFFRAFFRFFAFLFSATILLGLLTPFYSKEKKALHDMLAKTIEVEVDKS